MQSVITLLITYKYALLLPLSIFEGPIFTVIGGFFVTIGIFNPFVVYGIVVAGDIIGDTLFYITGRWGGPLLHRHGSKIGLSDERLASAHRYYEEHHRKAIIISKIVHGIGVAGLVTAGSMKVPFGKYIAATSLVSVLQSVVLLVVGILFGHAYLQIGRYLDYFAAGASVAALMAIVFYFLLFRKKTTDTSP